MQTEKGRVKKEHYFQILLLGFREAKPSNESLKVATCESGHVILFLWQLRDFFYKIMENCMNVWTMLSCFHICPFICLS